MKGSNGSALVTGAGGFIGSHLTQLLHASGYRVKAFVHYNSDNRWGWLDQVSCRGEIEVVAGDIRDYDSVYRALSGCATVFHLAALIGIPYSLVSPLAYLKTNCVGTYNVLQASLERRLENVLVVSTSEIYGSARYTPMDETHPLNAQSPYAASKIGAEQLALSYHRALGLPVKIVRPFNAYGPRQSARAVIPTIALQLLKGQRRVELGNLYPSRDMTYVADVASGILAVAETETLTGEATNLGTGTETSVGELARLIASILGVEPELALSESRRRSKTIEVDRLLCDNAKVCAHTGWKPSTSLGTGLRRTIEWIRDHIDLFDKETYAL